MRMSDIITNAIMEMISKSDIGTVEIKRNELANAFGCVPSQINYVISSRFTPEQGYIVESRRGGGGYIRIRRIQVDRSSALMHLVNSIGDEISRNTARVLIDNLSSQGIIPKGAADLIDAASDDKCYSMVPVELRNKLRASVLKQMLITCV